MTNQEIKTVGQTIAAETQIGGNTAERVGGVIEGIGEALDNKDAAVGYYLATMSGSTIYINASSYRLGTGGNLRAKMPAAATTACTLTVGNANAVPLWYNGAAVSADNSWEAGEIVTIFYDGTRFMASNSQGGGGQFGSGEKIKDILLSQALGDGTGTITSQKGVSDAIFNEIDISSIDSLKTLNDALAPSSSLKPTYYTVTATLSNVKLKVGSMAVISDNMRHVVTEIMATHYTLDDTGTLTNEHSDAEIFFIYRSVKLSGGTLPDPAGTWTKWRYVNSSVWSTAAEKIKYDNSQGILVSDNVQDALEELGDAIFEISESRISAGSSTQQYYTYNNGVIGKTNNSNYRCWPPVDITGYDALSLKFYLAEGSAKTFFTDENNIIVGDFLTNTSGDFKKYIIPQGAKKLYFSVNYNAQTDVAIYGLKREFGAQKVSYNNSQSGLSSTNVQDALDEIAQNSAEKATFNDVVDRATFKCVTLYDPYKTYNTNKGWIDSTGTVNAVSTSIYRYTGFINVNEGDIIHIHSNIPSTAAAVLSTWDSSKSFIMAIMSDGSGNQNIVYTIPSDVSYVRLTALVNEPSFTAKIELNAKNMLGDGLHTIQEITPIYISGYAYIDTSGEYVSGGSSYKYTHPIKVLENDEILVFSTMSTGGCAIAGYTSNNLQKSNSYTIGSDDANSPQWHKYTVPSGIEWIRVCHRYSDDGAIKVYIRRKVEKMPKKSIKVLFIGNSVNQDAVTYLPILMREYAPDVDYQFYIWYKGGYSLEQQLVLWNNNSNPDIFSVCKNGSSWANYSSITMEQVLNTYDFDIVQLQEYCHYKDVTNQSVLDDTLNTFNDCIEWIQNHYNKPFKVATLFHQPFLNISDGIDADTVYTRTKAIVEMYLKKTVTELLNPAGISMYRAMAIPELDALGNQGHLSPDARHAQEGLPCMMLSYVTAMWLLKQIGVQISCVNTQTVVTPNNYYQLNIPGQNPHTVTDADIIVGTTEQIRLSQLVAVKALKEGEYIRNQALTEYT